MRGNFRHIIIAAFALALVSTLESGGCRSKSDDTPKPTSTVATAPADASEKAGTTQAGSPGRPVIERAEPLPPPPALQLTVELAWDDPFVGENLPIRLYLSSPRADAALDAARATSAPAARPASPLSTVKADWPSAVRLSLFPVTDGKPAAAPVALDWSKLRLPPLAVMLGNPVAQWEIPASANLPAGEYLLRATWAGKDLIEASALEAPELTAEARFQIATPQSDQEKAVHGERMALIAYRENRFADARKLAGEAVKADPQSTTPQRYEMLLAQADACLAMDDFRAGLAIYRAMLKMPMDDRLAANLNQKVKILEKLAAKPK